MQGIKGALHNRGKNNKPQPRQRNENHVPWPLGRAPSSGTCFKELLLLSSGLNFLHMPSCWQGRCGRGNVVQRGEFRSTGAGWHRSSSGCHSIFRWFWWPGCIFGRDLGDLGEVFLRFSHSLDIVPHSRPLVLPLTVCVAHLSQLHLPGGCPVGQTPKSLRHSWIQPSLPLTEAWVGIWDGRNPLRGAAWSLNVLSLEVKIKPIQRAAQPQISLHRRC